MIDKNMRNKVCLTSKLFSCFFSGLNFLSSILFIQNAYNVQSEFHLLTRGWVRRRSENAITQSRLGVDRQASKQASRKVLFSGTEAAP